MADGQFIERSGSPAADDESWVERLANRVVFASGITRIVFAVGAGAVATLGLPPVDFPAAGFLAFPILVWLLDGAAADPAASRLKRFWPSFSAGWLFGFGYFVAGLWWLGAAMLVDAAEFAIFIPFAVLALPAVCAIYFGFATMLARLVWPDSGLRVLSLAAALALAEHFRGRLFTGFPWNEIGLIAAPTPLLSQTTSLVGLTGLTLLAIIVFAAPAALVDTRGRRSTLALAAVILAFHVGFGAWRLAMNPTEFTDDVTIRIVQPNIPQTLKWDPEEAERIFERELALSKAEETGDSEGQAGTSDAGSPDGAGVITIDGAKDDAEGEGPEGKGSEGAGTQGEAAGEDTRLVVWPETAFPFVLTSRPDALAALAEVLAPGETLLAGGTRVDPDGETGYRAYNSVFAIAENGEIIAARDKTHLVPFGEYLPFQEVLEDWGVTQLAEMPGGFTAGALRQPIALPGLPVVLPLICYEIVFDDEVRRNDALASTELVLNVTNDAWYGETPGPYQHFALARLTALSLGLPMVRAANSGISAITDPYGRIIAGLGLGETGAVEGRLPAATSPTVFARFGSWPFWIMFLATCMIVLCAQLCRGRSR